MSFNKEVIFIINEIIQNQGIALGIMGYLGFLAKDIPNKVVSYLEQKYSINISAGSHTDDIYKATIYIKCFLN